MRSTSAKRFWFRPMPVWSSTWSCGVKRAASCDQLKMSDLGTTTSDGRSTSPAARNSRRASGSACTWAVLPTPISFARQPPKRKRRKKCIQPALRADIRAVGRRIRPTARQFGRSQFPASLALPGGSHRTHAQGKQQVCCRLFRLPVAAEKTRRCRIEKPSRGSILLNRAPFVIEAQQGSHLIRAIALGWPIDFQAGPRNDRHFLTAQGRGQF